MSSASMFEVELSGWSDEALALLWADVEEYGQTGVLSADSRIRMLAHKWFDAHGSIGALQFQRCCDVAALVIARRAMGSGFGATTSSLVFIADGDFDEDEWADVVPVPGEVWVLDTNGLVTVLADAGFGDWACGPYSGHHVEPEWTRTHSRGQLRYRVSAPADEPASTGLVAKPSCSSCVHWKADDSLMIHIDDDDGNYDWVPMFPTGGGVCGQASSRNGMPANMASTAVARDADTHAAMLATSTDHYCNMWALRT